MVQTTDLDYDYFQICWTVRRLAHLQHNQSLTNLEFPNDAPEGTGGYTVAGKMASGLLCLKSPDTVT